MFVLRESVPHVFDQPGCNIDKKSFNISINKIMKGTDPNIEKKQELCKKLQENWRYILESNKCKNKPQGECKSEDGCVFDGGKCYTNGTLCGTISTINEKNKALNCYQYSHYLLLILIYVYMYQD